MVGVDHQIRNPIVIVGCQRSGTTVLRTMLNQHPDLLVHPLEPQFILGLRQRFGLCVRNVDAALSYVLRHPYVPDGLDRERFVRSCPAHPRGMALKDLVNQYLLAWAGPQSASRRVVLKHPELTFHLGLVDYLFAEPYIVHMVRDPRANVASQLARWPRFRVWEAAMLWRKAVRAARRWRSAGLMPYAEVVYRDLVQNPEASLRKLCWALDLSYTDAMLAFDQEEMQYTPNSPPTVARIRTVDPGRLSLWRHQLTPSDIRLIEVCAQEEMRWWGFEPDRPEVASRTFAMRLLSERLHYGVKTAGRSVKSVGRSLRWRLRAGCLTPHAANSQVER